jgi:hypothetical protein
VELELKSKSPQDGPSSSSTTQSCNDTQIDEPVSSTTGAIGSQLVDKYSIARDRPRRVIRKPARFHDDSNDGLITYALAVAQDILECTKPSTYSEAISSPDSSDCLMAMSDEIQSLYKNKTWDLCELPQGCRVLSCKSIYKQKDGIPSVEDARCKAGLVVCSCNKKEGMDFNEIFSPVVRQTSLRVLLAFVALFDMELEQLDVKIAFLHRELEEEIYMK